jgi:hypothetical protein
MREKTSLEDDVSEYYVGFRAPRVLIEALQSRAEEEGRTISDVVRRTLAESMAIGVTEVQGWRRRKTR